MNIKIDSRKILPGDTFVAIKEENDGHDYIEEAIKAGATTVVVEKGNYNVNTIMVKNTKKYLEEYLENNYYDEIRDICLIGMTGTNGKTTTCFLIYKALNEAGLSCAYIGTLGFYMADYYEKLDNTTPNLYEIYNLLLRCSKNNIKYVVMEVSSQGLDMGRVNTLLFDYVLFSNLTRDHLDYHKTFDNYIEAKKKLFNMTNGGIAILNSDDKNYKEFMLDKNKNITFGKNSNDYKIDIIKTSMSGSKLRINNKEYFTNLIGEYNIYNISMVIILLKLLNIENIENIIEKLESPSGRLNIIPFKSNYIIVDYAHTPDAVEKVLSTVNKIEHNNVITLIGCGGNRDKTKRPIMGEIATNNSDYVIFTSDNPRYEKPKLIIKDIVNKLDKKNYKIIVNRRKAIKKSIQLLTNNDILLLLGKGHENYQIIKNKKKKFSDSDYVLKYTRR